MTIETLRPFESAAVAAPMADSPDAARRRVETRLRWYGWDDHRIGSAHRIAPGGYRVAIVDGANRPVQVATIDERGCRFVPASAWRPSAAA
ncbi:MAG: hypothetical protein FJX67_07355 [Alphaproteobacteria bacterium]|nr:hypothetical protein [Alphaproteobacteria bacterium]